nr:putative multipass membrane protein [Hypoxylon sp. CO27-5]
MDSLNLWGSRDEGSTGWKKAAKVNCTILAAMSVTLIGCLITVTAKVGGIKHTLPFYGGGCDGGSVSQVNTVLHLLINIISTLVLASSNFFMQVLNSPSREELNKAHLKGSWMGIGIPSVRNAFSVSRFKTWCWICLFISSIPMHLFFNSAIFQEDQRNSDFHMTIATEEFLNEGFFYPPGASLVQPGFTFWSNIGVIINESHNFGKIDGFVRGPFGTPVNLTDYADENSAATKNVSHTALTAGRWERIEIGDCKQEYIACSGLKRHRNLVLIIDKPGGWVPNNIWHLKDNQTELWNRYMPVDQPNNLFFNAQCVMYASRSSTSPTQCQTSCTQALGAYFDYPHTQEEFVGAPDWNYPFFNNGTIYMINSSVTATTVNISGVNHTPAHGTTLTSGLQPGTFDLSVKYCLAEPIDWTCHIAISPTLLLAVTLCVIFKTCTAIVVTVVLSRRNQPPLVTLGDAMESFIKKPDPVTAGMCTIGQHDIRRAMIRSNVSVVPGPRQWQALKRRRGSAIPKSVWAASYILFAIGIGICVFFFDSINSGGGLTGSFFESEQNLFIDMPITFVSGVLLANSPQLLLSFCYLAYNNLFTRLQTAREWSLFSEGYHALRVTDPKSDQYSTYRLQLPYKYSIPLILISIFLHWLLSNTIYLFVSTGGYFGTDSFIVNNRNDPSLPPNTAVAVGYSSWSLLTLLIVSCVLTLVPIILSLKRLPSNMVHIGSNSLALSAACHVSPLSHAVKARSNSLLSKSPVTSKFDLPATPQSLELPRTRPAGESYSYEGIKNDGIEMQNLTPISNTTTRQSSQLSLSSRQLLPDHDRCSEDSTDSGDDQQGSPYTKLARSKVRWGVVKIPPEWHAEYDNEAGPVGHLSFGVEEDDVQPPEPGELYA